ncbi:MAG: SDR family NAD(P)-dependent oxidoreductase [Clostridia bacterium]|nr:SDR family NAD(P)-dependent oxidoreductase [Clostridia bacterium]
MALSDKTKKWLSKNCSASFKGKTVLITGATSGVGLKSAELMIYLKARLIMACRNLEKAQAVKRDLLKEYPQAEIGIMRLDLADFKSIDEFAENIKKNQTDIDVFLNNAGVFRKQGEYTADGFDMVLGTNYLGVYYLSKRVLPYLEALPHEVLYVNTVSIINKIASENYKDFLTGKRHNSISVYGCSKLCLSKYTYSLAQHYKGSNIRVIMNHPGISLTPLGVNAFGAAVKRLSGVFGWVFNSPEKSALSLPFIMSNDIPSGSIVGPNKVFGGWGYPKQNNVGKRIKTGAEELILFTDEQIKLRGDFLERR